MKKYLCALEANVNSEVFKFFEPGPIRENLDRHRILNNWFYFFINPPVDPVVIWRFENNSHNLHPGTNRYIGLSLRNNQSQMYAYLITESIKKLPEEIQIIELLDSYTNFTQKDRQRYNRSTKADKALLHWAIDDNEQKEKWQTKIYDDVDIFIKENLSYRWGVKYGGKTYYVGMPNAEIKKVIDSQDFSRLDKALTFLFYHVSEQENIIIEPA